MSANTQKTRSCPIPTRVIQLKDWSQLPDCYSQTPGGTLFSTTPGGEHMLLPKMGHRMCEGLFLWAGLQCAWCKQATHIQSTYCIHWPSCIMTCNSLLFYSKSNSIYVDKNLNDRPSTLARHCFVWFISVQCLFVVFSSHRSDPARL